MRSTDLKRYRKALLAKRLELLRRVHAARTSELSEGKEGAPDLGDRALETVSRELSYYLSTSERDILRRIDAALKRIDNKSYGACLNCDKPVQVGRLKAVPWARHCIDCQEMLERQE